MYFIIITTISGIWVEHVQGYCKVLLKGAGFWSISLQNKNQGNPSRADEWTSENRKWRTPNG